jgi:hypothetical protein
MHSNEVDMSTFTGERRSTGDSSYPACEIESDFKTDNGEEFRWRLAEMPDNAPMHWTARAEEADMNVRFVILIFGLSAVESQRRQRMDAYLEYLRPSQLLRKNMGA